MLLIMIASFILLLKSNSIFVGPVATFRMFVTITDIYS